MQHATKKVTFLKVSIVKAQDSRAIDIKDFSKDDLESLQKQDPFMYYSIPGVRIASMFSKDIDPSDKDALCLQRHLLLSKSLHPKGKALILRQIKDNGTPPNEN